MARLDWSKAKKRIPDPAQYKRRKDPSPEEAMELLEAKKQNNAQRAAKARRTRRANLKREAERQARAKKRIEAAERAYDLKQAAIRKERDAVLALVQQEELARSARRGASRSKLAKRKESPKYEAERQRDRETREASTHPVIVEIKIARSSLLKKWKEAYLRRK